jgi:hypothetical protein
VTRELSVSLCVFRAPLQWQKMAFFQKAAELNKQVFQLGPYGRSVLELGFVSDREM